MLSVDVRLSLASSSTRPQAKGERLQELASRGVRLYFSQVGEYLREAVALVRREPQQFPAYAFHRLHRRVGIDFVVTAAVEKPDEVDNQPGKSWHKRIHGSHPRNLADPYDSKAAVSRGMRMHRVPF
ncbi:hypothetical protein [Streptomyces albogriseolus]|uniref:hypothetical protein n=1 Tax=Streptomyces albogriseolus TaxID=1887 RepID=UPI00367ED305